MPSRPFVEQGGGLVAIHGASASFGKSNVWFHMVGARFAGHAPGTHPMPVTIVDTGHPITRGLKTSPSRTRSIRTASRRGSTATSSRGSRSGRRTPRRRTATTTPCGRSTRGRGSRLQLPRSRSGGLAEPVLAEDGGPEHLLGGRTSPGGQDPAVGARSRNERSPLVLPGRRHLLASGRLLDHYPGLLQPRGTRGRTVSAPSSEC